MASLIAEGIEFGKAAPVVFVSSEETESINQNLLQNFAGSYMRNGSFLTLQQMELELDEVRDEWACHLLEWI